MNTAAALKVEADDAKRVREAVEAAVDDEFRKERQKINVNGPAPVFSREHFWYVLVGCLLTTQQRSTRGSPVDQFLTLAPFPLNLSACEQSVDIAAFTVEEIRKFGGIRRGLTIARQLRDNLQRLNDGAWSDAEMTFELLFRLRSRVPIAEHKNAERIAARWADATFNGIGPKQARNLWQWLGLTRYETPLDSRVVGWINNNLSVELESSQLLDSRGYEAVMDYVQALCDAAGVLPCIFDAVAFLYDDNQPKRTAQKKVTTVPGFVNAHGQVVIRNTGAPGTDHMQYTYQLACSRCGYVYGANGSDIHERRCPKCDGSKPGLRI